MSTEPAQAPPALDFPPGGAVRRLTLRQSADGRYTAAVEIDLAHPDWDFCRLARVQLTDDGRTSLDTVIAVADKPGLPNYGCGEVNVDAVDPTTRHSVGRDTTHAVTPLTAGELQKEYGVEAWKHLRRAQDGTPDAEGKALLGRALDALDIQAAAAEVEVLAPDVPAPTPAPVAAEPPAPPPPPLPPVPPPPAPPTDVQLELARLRALFEQKILRDQGQQQVIAKLHDALKDAQADLVFKILRPVLLEVIRLHDDLAAAAAAADSPPKFAELRQDAEDLLGRLGVERYECDGDRLDPARQKVRRAVPTADPSEVGRVVESLRPGFTYHGGVILRPEEVAALSKPPRDGGSRP